VSLPQKRVAGDEVRQWTIPMTSVDGFAIVIIVCFYTENSNFNIF
jgi:hypothetical protein